MSTTRGVLVAMALTAAVGCAARGPLLVEGSRDIAAVETLDRLWALSYQRHDTATALQLMSEDFFMTATNGATKDRASELADVRPTPGLRMEYFRTESVRVRVNGSAAVVAGIAAWAYEMNSRNSTTRRRYTATYVRGGPLGWQLVALHMGRTE